MDYWAIADAERTAYADLCDSMTPAQWDTPSLCDGWKVRDVVAHVNDGNDLKLGRALLTLAKYGFRLNTMLQREAQKQGTQATEQLASAMRASIGSRSLPPGTKPIDLPVEYIVHQQDVRRAIGIPRSYPADTMRAALDRLSGMGNAILPGKKRAHGLHLRATDLDWEHGEGDEVSGPGEALLLAMAGRDVALADLQGQGLETLKSRLAH